MITDHAFKPYTDMPELCVAELSGSGDTCNREREEHAMTSVEVETPHSPYAWIIDQDHLYEPGADYLTDEKGVSGPRNAHVSGEAQGYEADKAELTRNYQHHHQFRMYDDDGELYYTGTLFWNGEADEPDSADRYDDVTYGPLRDFGTPNAGAVVIRYTDRPGWEVG